MVKTVCALFALQQARGARRQLLELADAGVDALNDARRLQGVRSVQRRCRARVSASMRLGKDLQGQDVVVAVDDETREGSRLR